MSTSVAPTPLTDLLAAHGQEHLLCFWEELDEFQQKHLAAQIEAIDFEQIATLYQGVVDQTDWHAAARRAEPPVAMRQADREAGKGGGLGTTPDEAKRLGQVALDQGKVGILLVAGGQGSRLGFDQPKGMFPIGPVSDHSLLQIHIEKAVALAERHGVGVPVYLMTSPVTHEEQVAFLAANDRFGLAEEDLYVFCQGTMPAVDAATGQLLMADRGNLFLSPDGHGGTIAALEASGATAHMRGRGIEQLFYLQVDNPMVPIGDAEFVGYHLAAQSELTSMAVAKSAPDDKLGNFVSVDGELCVIEYIDFPEEVAQQLDDAGGLRFWAGSIAVHVFAVSFLERMLAEKDALPFHTARKKVSYLDSKGELVTPSENNALKFERFIFDLLPQAANPIVVEYAEAEVFAPLKNAPGAPKDTAQYVQRFLLDQHRKWLTMAGVEVPADARVEISPLWALDAEGVAQRAKQPIAIEATTFLG